MFQVELSTKIRSAVADVQSNLIYDRPIDFCSRKNDRESASHEFSPQRSVMFRWPIQGGASRAGMTNHKSATAWVNALGGKKIANLLKSLFRDPKPTGSRGARGTKCVNQFQVRIRLVRIPVKMDIDSGGRWSPFPVEGGQESERSDAGVFIMEQVSSFSQPCSWFF